MHLNIRHDISCRFDLPARNLVSILRICPRSHDGQHVSDWWIDSDIDCGLKMAEDEFGNITHRFSAGGVIEQMTLSASGQVDTFDTAGVTRGSAERLPPEIFLRDTPLTAADADIRQFAETATAKEATELGKLHALLGGINAALAVESSDDARSAADAFARKSGGIGSQAHVFIACARHLGIPSRFVGGYLVRGRSDEAACHAWAESYLPDLGWVGFDPVNNLCPRGEHVRRAAAFDALGAALVRTVHSENVTHALKIAAMA